MKSSNGRDDATHIALAPELHFCARNFYLYRVEKKIHLVSLCLFV